MDPLEEEVVNPEQYARQCMYCDAVLPAHESRCYAARCAALTDAQLIAEACQALDKDGCDLHVKAIERLLVVADVLAATDPMTDVVTDDDEDNGPCRYCAHMDHTETCPWRLAKALTERRGKP